MPMLVVQIPARPRHGPRRAGATEADAAPREYRHLLVSDAGAVLAQGRAAAALLPRAEQVTAVLGDADVGWQRIVVPVAPAARLSAALAGVAEEALLDDTAHTHLALAPDAVAGQAGWAAAVDRRWLRNELALLEAAGVFVDRIVPAATPVEPGAVHFAEIEGGGPDGQGAALLVWTSADGVALLRLDGRLAAVRLPRPMTAELRVTAEPAVAAAAERWLGRPVELLGAPERLLAATASRWNLRQFEFARRARGMRLLGDAWRRWWSPPWRLARAGVAALLLVQLLGLGLEAARLRGAIADRERTLVQLLQTTFPQVRAVLDAPLQMEREVQTLRTAAGKPGSNDLEPMLAAAAAAWPAERPPVDSLRFEPGRLSLAAAGWQPADVDAFRSRLGGGSWQVEFADGRISLLRRAAVDRRLPL